MVAFVCRNTVCSDEKRSRCFPRPFLEAARFFLGMFSLFSALFFLGCGSEKPVRSVVVYTSVDQHYAEPVLKAFEAQTGIAVKAVYDVEATKTTGLVNRLIAEKQRPLADVFWNGEFVQTLLLKEKDCLAAYASPEAERIPAQYRDETHYWTGFGGRARVLIINTRHLSPEDAPASIMDLLSPRWPGEKIGIAYPLFGTTATQAAALYATLGRQRAGAFFKGLRERGVQVLDGNSVVRDLVAAGQLWMGLTDTDDACSAKAKGLAVDLVFPDQHEDALGTLIIPNTVALIAGAPHPRQARRLIDYLLREDVERELIRSGWCHTPVSGLSADGSCVPTGAIRGMDIHLTGIAVHLLNSKNDLAEIFMR